MIKEPIHLEAKKLGANLTEIRKMLPNSYSRRKNYSAKQVQAVWDYRKAGLTIKEARHKVFEWVTTLGSHLNFGDLPGGEIASIGQRRDAIHRKYLAFLEEVGKIPLYEGGSLTWQQPEARIEAGGRTIIVRHKEDVTWPETKFGTSARYPASRTVSYTSHLIRTAPPSAIEVKRLHLYEPQYPNETLDMFTEKQFTHDARGNWAREVVAKLLGREVSQGVVTPWRSSTKWEEMMRNQSAVRPDDRQVQKAMLRHQRKSHIPKPRLSR